MADKVACAQWRGPILPGSIKAACAACGAAVSLSKEGQAWLAQDATRLIVCLECAINSGKPPAGAVPGAIEAARAEAARLARDN